METTGKEHLEARLRDKEEKKKQREYADGRRRAKVKKIKEGDKVLIQQKKTTVKPPFDPKPFTVTKVENTKITAKRGKTSKTRNVKKWKLIRDRPERFDNNEKYEEGSDESDGDLDWDFDLHKLAPLVQQEVAAEIVVPDEAAEVAVDEVHDNAGVEENEMGEDDLLRFY